MNERKMMPAIEDAIAADFPAIRQLLAVAGLPHEDLHENAVRSFMVSRMGGKAGSLVAAAGLEVSFQASDGLLRSVVVAPYLRGRGIGESLVAAVEDQARRWGMRQLWLLTTTAPDFFRRIGYLEMKRAQAPESVQQSAEFKRLCPASALCFSKLL